MKPRPASHAGPRRAVVALGPCIVIIAGLAVFAAFTFTGARTPGVAVRLRTALPTPVRVAVPPPQPSSTIFMRPHFFGAKGDRADAAFVPLVIRSVLHHNPGAHVYMLHNDPGFTMPDQPRFHGLLMEDYDTPATRQLKATYQHMSTNPAQYELYSMAAYFYVGALMDALGLDSVVVVETDVLVFCDLWASLARHWDLAGLDAVLTRRRVMAASYVTRVYIETFINVALAFYSEAPVMDALRAYARRVKWGGVSDMTVNAWLAKPGFVRRNAANHTVRVAELSQLVEVGQGHDSWPCPSSTCSSHDSSTLAYIDSNLRTGNYTFGAFDMDCTNAALGCIKRLYDAARPGGPPRACLQPSTFVDMWALHFQGETKALIPAVFDRFVQPGLADARP